MFATPSASVLIRPKDNRCRYWAKSPDPAKLPLPFKVVGAADLPSPYLKPGSEELLPGEVLFEGEEVSHKRLLGWSYQVTLVDHEGATLTITPTEEDKQSLKSQGLSPEYLNGSSLLAACVRVAIAWRLGFTVRGRTRQPQSIKPCWSFPL